MGKLNRSAMQSAAAMKIAVLLLGCSVSCLGYQLGDAERAHIASAFQQHQGSGVVPIGQLRPMVSSIIDLVSTGKFKAAVHKKHVDFLLVGYQNQLTQDFTLDQFVDVTTQLEVRDANNPPPTPVKPACLDEDGTPLPKHIQKRLGSCQLKQLRAKLERNRLTMPLFDTLRWVRDFERSLEAMWEIYASGHDPMNIVVFPTDPREYRKEG